MLPLTARATRHALPWADNRYFTIQAWCKHCACEFAVYTNWYGKPSELAFLHEVHRKQRCVHCGEPFGEEPAVHYTWQLQDGPVGLWRRVWERPPKLDEVDADAGVLLAMTDPFYDE